MSIRVIQQLSKLDLPKREKAVALALALHLNDKRPQDGAWPSQRRLQAESGWGERAVQYALRYLQEEGIIKRIGWKPAYGGSVPVYVFHLERGTIHPYFIEPEDESPPQSELPFAAEGANCADTPAGDAEGAARQNVTPRTGCTQSTRNQVLNKSENSAAPQNDFEDQKHGEMTEERFLAFKKRIRRIALEKFGTCEPLDHPVWEQMRAKFFPPDWRG